MCAARRYFPPSLKKTRADCHGYNYTNGFITGINSALISLLPVISSKWRRGETYSSQKKMIFLNRQNLPHQEDCQMETDIIRIYCYDEEEFFADCGQHFHTLEMGFTGVK